MEQFQTEPPRGPSWIQVHFGVDTLLWLGLAVAFSLGMIHLLRRYERSTAKHLAIAFLVPLPLLLGVMISLELLSFGLSGLIANGPVGAEERAKEDLTRSYKVLFTAAACCLPAAMVARGALNHSDAQREAPEATCK